MNEIRCAHASDTGVVRDHNEDSHLADTENGLFVVADGMGGHEGGEVASAVVVDSMSRNVKNGMGLGEALCKAHHQVLEAARNGEGHKEMGATAVALQFSGADYTVSWVGDSRAYLWDGSELTQLTHDHSYVQNLLDAGAITTEEARDHPLRSNITQALGAEELTDVAPDTVSGRLYHGQKILLCSDGLSSELEDEAISAIIEEEESEEACVSRLIRSAKESGGEDNITVILISSPLPKPAEKAGRGDTRPMDASRIGKTAKRPSRFSLLRKTVIAAALLAALAVIGYAGYTSFSGKGAKEAPRGQHVPAPDRPAPPGGSAGDGNGPEPAPSNSMD